MNEKHRLINRVRMYMVILLVSLLVVLLVGVALLISYLNTSEKWFLISLSIFFAAFMIAYIILCTILIHRTHSLYYSQIYKNTYDNLKKLQNNETNLSEYKNLEYDEIKELNEATKEIKNRFRNAYLVNKEVDYKSIELEYLNIDRRIVDYVSFKNHIRDVLFISQSFRNVLIEIYYDLNNDVPFIELDRIMYAHEKAFNSYEDALFMHESDNKSLLIYLPHIDSFSNIKEIIERLRHESTVMSREAKGLVATPAKYAIVAYPYSTEEYIFSDLRYARRQNKSVNIFLPNRSKNNMTSNVLMNTSMNINHISKIMEGLALLDIDSIDVRDLVVKMTKLFDDLSKYIAVENSGVLRYDEVNKIYVPLIRSTDSLLFNDHKVIDNRLIEAFSATCDPDNSFYFSNRKHANYLLGREIDKCNIQSGFYYVVRGEEGKAIGIIYFLNYKNEFPLNSYLREALYIISLRVAHVFEKMRYLDIINMLSNENDYLLSLSPYSLYKVDEEYKMSYVSRRLKKMFPKASKGETCYKVLYGLEKPCYDCPLKTSKKKLSDLKGKRYEISLSLNDSHRENKTILMEKVDKDYVSDDLFNRDLLIYSYRALNETMNNEYLSNGRGYILLLTIDNYDNLLHKKGSEDLLYIMRTFINKIKNVLKTDNIYYYNPTTLAIFLPLIGHGNVIDKCEMIYDISKEHSYGDVNDELGVTYLPIAYPGGYASSDDFFYHLSEFYNSPKYERGKDFVYFYNYPISRSASKRTFMLSVIESEFSGHSTTSVNLQPMVRVKDRHIYGAEILLRINDTQRNAVISAFEISRIALEENKTHMITEAIINFIGNLYAEYGKSTFTINEFNRICINIDKTYFKDPELIKSMSKLIKANNIPNNFISFEIPEDMIHDNIEDIRNMSNELKAFHVYFSVDRYTGAHVGVELLKELGFNEIKIARDIIIDIEKDFKHYKELSDIVKSAHNVNMNIAAVGVENEAQFNLLKELDPEMMVQGYYLYKPLSRSDLIAAIISYNS